MLPSTLTSPETPRCKHTGKPLDATSNWPEWARRTNQRVSREYDRKRRLLMDRARVRGVRPNVSTHPCHHLWKKGDWQGVYRKLGRFQPDTSIDVTLAQLRHKYAADLNALERGHTRAVEGYIYIIENTVANHGLIKIGTAIDPESRLNSFQTADPYRAFRLRFSSYTSNRRQLESMVHDQLADFHVGGEWYDVKMWHAITIIKESKNALRE